MGKITSINDIRPETVHFDSDLVRMGSFRAPVGHAAFGRECRIGDWHLVAFPRSSVVIEQIGRGEVVSDPHLAMLYNQRQRYLRRPVSADGDRCEWFAFNPGAIREAVGGESFDLTHARISSQTYMRQRLLLTYALRYPEDRFSIEVAALGILDELSETLMQQRGRAAAAVRPRHRELADAARSELLQRVGAPARLDAVAAALGCSPYHLCHVFRRVTGTTLSRYLTGLRLRAALEPLADSNAGLTQIALELGFSSHSHFTSQFSRVFGMPPSAFRVDTRTMAETRKNLKALTEPPIR